MLKSAVVIRVFNRNYSKFRAKYKETNTPSAKKKLATYKALEHFDDFYKQVYGSKWQLIRSGLLCKQKYIAVVNNYSDTEEICAGLEARGAINVSKIFKATAMTLKDDDVKVERQKSLDKIYEMDKEQPDVVEKEEEKKVERNFSLQKSLDEAEIDTSRIINASNSLSLGGLHEFIPATKIKGREDFILESDHFRYYSKSSDFPLKIEREHKLEFPENLHVYCYEEENLTEFPHPKSGSTGVLNYYLMDGASLLPVLALDLKPGVRMLDVCSAPGGKSLIALQTLYPDAIVCNDSSISRTNRIKNVFKQYLFDFDEKWIKTGKIRISCADARYMGMGEEYDRVLVDVPCTTDRHSVNEDDNNIFKADRIKERLKLPELQSEILFNALQMVSVGGTVVYSTCSLSPIQNDGVVHMALKRLWEETKIEMVVKDMTMALRQVKHVYKMASPRLMKFGHQVVPNSMQNFGPSYFCKLQRIK